MRVVCARCNTALEAKDRFCPNCGVLANADLATRRIGAGGSSRRWVACISLILFALALGWWLGHHGVRMIERVDCENTGGSSHPTSAPSRKLLSVLKLAVQPSTGLEPVALHRPH